MIDFPYISEICTPTSSKVLMLVIDGLGGAPHPEKGKSELEVARTPNLDRLGGSERLRPHDSGAAGHNPGQRARASVPLRLRPGQVHDRPGRAGGAGHRH